MLHLNVYHDIYPCKTQMVFKKNLDKSLFYNMNTSSHVFLLTLFSDCSTRGCRNGDQCPYLHAVSLRLFDLLVLPFGMLRAIFDNDFKCIKSYTP